MTAQAAEKMRFRLHLYRTAGDAYFLGAVCEQTSY
jgi:hypothetical protein